MRSLRRNLAVRRRQPGTRGARRAKRVTRLVEHMNRLREGDDLYDEAMYTGDYSRFARWDKLCPRVPEAALKLRGRIHWWERHA